MLCIIINGAKNMMTLREVTDISAGYSFRGKILEKKGGGVSVIQMKDVSVEKGLRSESVIETALSGKREPDLLRLKDILFVARGSNHYAVLYNGRFDKAVASPHFFVVRTRLQDVVPEFIVWQLNQLSVQRYFKREAEGSVTKSIKRVSLEQTPIFLPDIKQQQVILRMYKNLYEQKRIYSELLINTEKRMKNIAFNLEEDFNRPITRIGK